MVRVAVITGASAGIGAAAVGVFAKGGYDVVLAARRMSMLETVATAVRRDCPERRVLSVECDVASSESVAGLFAKVKAEFGKLNVLVNNAGYGVYGSIESTPIENFAANMETNYLGVIRCTQAALPLLREAVKRNEHATIVMVSSIVGKRAMPNVGSYCATKFALEGLSETLRVELHDDKIAVSVVNPGVTKTDFSKAAVGSRPPTFMQGGMTSEAVAKVLLTAAQWPVRNKYLTLAGKACVAIQWAVPKLLDSVLLKRVWRAGKEKT